MRSSASTPISRIAWAGDGPRALAIASLAGRGRKSRSVFHRRLWTFALDRKRTRRHRRHAAAGAGLGGRRISRMAGSGIDPRFRRPPAGRDAGISTARAGRSARQHAQGEARRSAGGAAGRRFCMRTIGGSCRGDPLSARRGADRPSALRIRRLRNSGCVGAESRGAVRRGARHAGAGSGGGSRGQVSGAGGGDAATRARSSPAISAAPALAELERRAVRAGASSIRTYLSDTPWPTQPWPGPSIWCCWMRPAAAPAPGGGSRN